MPSSLIMRSYKDYYARKYIEGEIPLVEVPVSPNVKTRVKEIVYSPTKYRETEGIKGYRNKLLEPRKNTRNQRKSTTLIRASF